MCHTVIIGRLFTKLKQATSAVALFYPCIQHCAVFQLQCHASGRTALMQPVLLTPVPKKPTHTHTHTHDQQLSVNTHRRTCALEEPTNQSDALSGRKHQHWTPETDTATQVKDCASQQPGSPGERGMLPAAAVVGVHAPGRALAAAA
jgi:hypothetical protein